MKKIALIYLGRKGGGAAYAYEMAKGLIANGVELYIFISRQVENYEKWLALSSKNIEAIDTYSNKLNFIINTLKFRFKGYKKLKRKYLGLSVDACYFPMGLEHPWDRYLANLLDSKQQIITIHDPIAHSSNNMNAKLLTLATKVLNIGVKKRKPDDIIILSKTFLPYLQSKSIVSNDHIYVIPHCSFEYYRNYNHEFYDYDYKNVNFLFFGRIDKYKGLDVLGKAFKEFHKTNSASTLTIVGSGDFSPYKSTYSDIEGVKLINRWIPDDEVYSYFHPDKNVILVLPYIDATQSGVIPIAMTAGIPIIASNLAGLAEQIEDNKTGYLVNPGDINELVKKMLFVAENDNSEIIRNAMKYISSLSGLELSKRVIEIVNKTKDINNTI